MTGNSFDSESIQIPGGVSLLVQDVKNILDSLLDIFGLWPDFIYIAIGAILLLAGLSILIWAALEGGSSGNAQ